MFDDNDYDPLLFDGICDWDPDLMSIEQGSNTYVEYLNECLGDSPTSNLQKAEPEDFRKIFSLDTHLDRKEWLLQDTGTKRLRSPRLLEFLILLLTKRHYRSYASFIDQSKGTFQIYLPEKVAELWQAVKSRQSNRKMTYDKFARAIRWFYKSNIMQKTNMRYTFQFTPQTLRRYFDKDTSQLSRPKDLIRIKCARDVREEISTRQTLIMV